MRKYTILFAALILTALSNICSAQTLPHFEEPEYLSTRLRVGGNAYWFGGPDGGNSGWQTLGAEFNDSGNNAAVQYSLSATAAVAPYGESAMSVSAIGNVSILPNSQQFVVLGVDSTLEDRHVADLYDADYIAGSIEFTVNASGASTITRNVYIEVRLAGIGNDDDTEGDVIAWLQVGNNGYAGWSISHGIDIDDYYIASTGIITVPFEEEVGDCQVIINFNATGTVNGFSNLIDQQSLTVDVYASQDP